MTPRRRALADAAGVHVELTPVNPLRPAAPVRRLRQDDDRRPVWMARVRGVEQAAGVIKVIVTIKKRPDLTSEQFRHHYETVQAPLVDRLLPYYATYRRNYVDGPVGGRTHACDWDVFTELEFTDRDAYDAWLAALADPEVLAQIRADEANFLVSSETRMWAVSPMASEY